jgi:hypothetical protein
MKGEDSREKGRVEGLLRGVNDRKRKRRKGKMDVQVISSQFLSSPLIRLDSRFS